MIYTKYLTRTEQRIDFIKITDKIQKIVTESKIQYGITSALSDPKGSSGTQ